MQRGAIQDQHAVLQQPQIITAQPSSVAVTTVNIVDVPTRQIVDVNPGTRDWSTGIFGCCNDIAGCRSFCFKNQVDHIHKFVVSCCSEH